MVYLVVKGTTFPDEFIFQCDASTPINPPVEGPVDTTTAATHTHTCASRSVCHLLNTRHQLKMLLLSAQELSQERRAAAGTAAEAEEQERLDRYDALVETSFASLKDSTTPITDDSVYDAVLADLRSQTTQLFPAYCTHPDGLDAAIQLLYTQHDENPELPESERLTMYHCRAIIDPKWKAREQLNETETGLWFCGKLMDKATLRDYCGRNEKSKLVVKAGSRTGPAPSGEPRIRYEDQRALFEHMRCKRETLATLEESELRDRVLQQSRGAVRMPFAAAGTGDAAPPAVLQTANLRPIYSHKEERVVGED